ncbi:alanine:cation symporter family protein, partial [Bacillus haynesii]|nr:alanine:cation symporter family protein [Bacillus haynesii]
MGRVTSLFVPIMALFYVIAGLIILVSNFELVPGAVGLI